MTTARNIANAKLTIGSTTISLGSTAVTTISGLTLSGATLTGSLTAGGSAGTSGYLLSSTGTGVQWITPPAGYLAPTIGSTQIASNTTYTTLPGVTSVNGTTIPLNGTLITSATTSLPSVTSVNGISLTPATTGFSIAGGSTTSKTLTLSNTLTLAGTDSSTLNIGAGGTLGTAAFTASTAYQASSTTLTGVAGLSSSGTGLVKNTAGTWSYDTNAYITGSSPTITTPIIDVINAASATGTTQSLFPNTSTGTINIGGSALTTGTINIGTAGTGVNPIVLGKSTSTITFNGTLATVNGVLYATGGDGATNSSIRAVGYNQRGGAGYHGFLDVTNTFGTATTPNKYFRLNSTGALEIVNSAYSATIFSLTDAGALNVPSSVTAGSFVKSGGTSAQYLMADGSVSSGSGGGVTSFSAGTTGLTPSTGTTGAVTLAGTLVVANGGTGTGTAGITAFNNITGYTATGATGTTSTNLVFSTSPTLTTPTLTSPAVSAGAASAAPIRFTPTGAVLLTTPVAGSLEVDSAGVLYYTTSSTRQAVALGTPLTNPMTTAGDMIYGGVSGAATRLAGQTTNATYGLTQVTAGGVAGNPTWTTATGTGAPVYATSPSLTTPTLGAATATSINKVTITAPTTSATLTLITGSTLATSTAASLTLALSSAATTTATIPSGTVTLMDLGTTQTITGVKTAAAGTTATASQIGYMGIPQNLNPTSPYTIVAADNGKHIYMTTTGGTITIPANGTLALPIGFTFSIINASAVSTSVAITTDTMYLAGSGTTGIRTLAAFGMATAVKIAATTWIISGNGLT